MQVSDLWKNILNKAIEGDFSAIHLEPEVIRFQSDSEFRDIGELSSDVFENLMNWIKILGPGWKVKKGEDSFELKVEIYFLDGQEKAIVKIFRDEGIGLNNLKGLYLIKSKKSLDKVINYLKRQDLNIISVEDDFKEIKKVKINLEKGLTLARALAIVEAEVIIIPHLEEPEILDEVVKKALTGKLILVNKLVDSEDEALDYLLAQGLEEHLISSIWQGSI